MHYEFNLVSVVHTEEVTTSYPRLPSAPQQEAPSVETAALPSTDGASPALRVLIHDWAKKTDAWENIDVDQQESAKGKAVQSAMQAALCRA